jgi:adenine-specific DNA-methyltransferase
MDAMASLAQARLDQVEQELGPARFKAPGVLLYHGDSFELMNRLRGEAFDLTITSPPYNIGKEYETKLDVADYVEWCRSWIAAIYRATRPKGAFWLNLGYLEVPGRALAVPIPYLLWEKTPFVLVQEIVWHYGAGVACRHTFSPRNEKFLWYVRDPDNYVFNLEEVRDPDVKYPNQKKNGKLKCNPNGKNPTDVWQFPKVTSGAGRSSEERTEHPAQFPLAVIDRIVKACSPLGSLILDPFVGSGTTAEAALRNGRAVVGIDTNERYLQIASDRLVAATAQRALFEDSSITATR